MGKKSPSPAQTGFSALPGQLQVPGFEIADKAMADFDAGPQQFFPGQTFANFDPLQQQGFNSQLDFANNQLPGQLQNINSSFDNALNAGNLFSDPSVMAGLDTIESRANQNFLESTLPGLRRGATGAGQEFGTRGELAAGVAGSRLGRDIGDAQAQFLANQLGSARQLQGASLALSPQQAQLGLLPGQIQGQIGGQFQGMDQNAITEAMNRFNFEQQAPDTNLDQLVNRFGNISGFGSSSSIGGTPGGTSPIAGALGGGMLGNALSAGTWLGAGPGAMLGPVGIGGAILGGLLS